MVMRLQSRREKWALSVGTIFLVIDILMIYDWFIVGSMIFGSAFLILVLSTMRKNHWPIRFARITIFTSLLFLLANPVPTQWGPQFYRHWGDNRTELIEPDHPIMPELNQSFQIWFVERNEFSFSEDTNFEHQVREVDRYIRWERFNYTLDHLSWYVFDHLATIDEIIGTEDEEGKWHDDCDGISTITASFLIFLGFSNTYISEVTYHYHTMVYPEDVNPRTEEGYFQGIALYRSGAMEGDHESYYMWNQTDMFIPGGRPLWKSMGEIFTDGNAWEREMVDLFEGFYTGMPLWGNIILVYIISFLAGALCCSFVQLGINPKLQSGYKKHHGKKYAAFLGLIIFFGFTFGYLIAWLSIHKGMDLTYLCNPILFCAFTLSFILADRHFIKNRKFVHH